METMIDHLANSLGKDVEAIKAANLYKDGHMCLVGKEMTDCNVTSIWERKCVCRLLSSNQEHRFINALCVYVCDIIIEL